MKTLSLKTNLTLCSFFTVLTACTAKTTPPTNISTDEAPTIASPAAALPFDVAKADASFNAVVRIIDASTPFTVPVAGASLTFNGQVYASDPQGRIVVPNVLVRNTKAAQLQANGFLPRAVLLDYQSAGAQPLRIALTKAGVSAVINTADGGTITHGPMLLTMPINAFVSADGGAFSGNVNLAALGIDPVDLITISMTRGLTIRSDFDRDRIPQGFDVGIRADGSVAFLAPESVFQIEMTDDNGERVGISAETPVTATFKLSALTQHKDGPSRMYHFDETAQLWREEGTCNVATIDGVTLCSGAITKTGIWSLPSAKDTTKASCGNFEVAYVFDKKYPASLSVGGETYENPIANSLKVEALPSNKGETYKPRFKSADGTFFLTPFGQAQVVITVQAFRLDGEKVIRDTLRYQFRATKSGDTAAQFPVDFPLFAARQTIKETDLADMVVPPPARYGCPVMSLNVSLDDAEVLSEEVIGTVSVPQVATCAVDNGGCGDSAYVQCTDQEGAAPKCDDIDECATSNGGCGDALIYKCKNNAGAPPSCSYANK